MKLFTEFLNNEEGAKLEIYCCALESGEVENLIPLLEKKGFELTFIDADSLQAKISGGYKEIREVREDLEKEGFRWSEKTLSRERE